MGQAQHPAVDWPELRFPPINLWVMPAGSVEPTIHAARRTRQPAPIHTPRTQIMQLLAARGGKA